LPRSKYFYKMKQLLFWFNICMVFVYLAAAITLFFFNAIPRLPDNSRKLAGAVIFCYGIYRLIASILKKKKIDKDENEN
jgi:hypothetical protein